MLMIHHKKHGTHDHHQTRHIVALGDDSPSVDPSVSVRPLAKADLDNDTPPKEEKMKDPSPSSRGSAAARIRKLIVKEVTRRKGKHRRSSTCPAGPQLERSGSINRELDKPTSKKVTPGGSDFVPDQHILDNEINGKTDHKEDSSPILHNKASKQKDGGRGDELPTPVKCQLCCIRNMDIECHLGKKPMEEESSSEEKEQEAMHILKQMNSNSNGEIKRKKSLKNIGKSASTHQSRELMHAIEVLSLNKNFFLKILEDPESSLAQHFHAQQQASSDKSRKRSLSKLGTFPMPGTATSSSSSTRQDKKGNLAGSSSMKRKQQQQQNIDSTKESTAASSSKQSRPGDNTDIPPPSGNNRRFKDLRQKIHHVIRESRDERRRIAMDAVLHKVPYGKKYSEDDQISKEIQAADQISDGNSTMTRNLSVSPSRNKNKPQQGTMKRSPSLDESLEKYSHLFKTSCTNRHTPAPMESAMSRYVDNEKNCSSTSMTGGNAARKGLGRMFSSPDLQLYYSRHCEDPNALNKPLNKTRSSRTSRTRSSSFSDDIPNLEASPAACSEKEGLENSKSQEIYSSDDDQNLGLCLTRSQHQELVDAVEALHKLKMLDVNDETSEDDDDNQAIGLNEPPLDDAIHEQEATSSSPQQLLPAESSTSPNNNNFLHQVYIDKEDQEDFDYVKDILRLSGFTENQLLGKWHSDKQPVDPSLFLELESFSLIQQNCSANGALTSASSTSTDEHEDDGHEREEHDYDDSFNNNHLLLFDLINEVLLSIHERSSSYWPSALTTTSKTRTMPKGYHVLEEVWRNVSWYLRSSRPSNNQQQAASSSTDYITVRDLARDEGWMNLQGDAECVAIELDNMIFDDLIFELASS